jgi:hypothetical protein
MLAGHAVFWSPARLAGPTGSAEHPAIALLSLFLLAFHPFLALAGVAVGIFLVVNDFVEAPTGEENLLQSLGLRESSDRWDSKGLHRVPRKVRKKKERKPPARDME